MTKEAKIQWKKKGYPSISGAGETEQLYVKE